MPRVAAAVAATVAAASRSGRSRLPTTQPSALDESTPHSTECAHISRNSRTGTSGEDQSVALSSGPSPKTTISMSTKKWNDQRVYTSTFPALLRFFHHPVSFDTDLAPLGLPAHRPRDSRCGHRWTANTVIMTQARTVPAPSLTDPGPARQ